MTTIWIDLVIVFWLLLFGGMALLPMITGATSARSQRSQPIEDRVISIRPARPDYTVSSTLRAPAAQDHDRDHDHHDRPAA